MDGPTIREAVALFDNPETLENAVSELQSNGIDRSELSVLAPPSLAEQPADVRREAGDPKTPREPVVSDTDFRQGRVLGTSLAATIAAFAAAGISVATGGVAAATVAAAAVAAGGVAAAGALVGRILAEDQASFLDAQLARGGVLLWVRTQDAAAERRTLEVLRRHSAHVYLHDLRTQGSTQPIRNARAQTRNPEVIDR